MSFGFCFGGFLLLLVSLYVVIEGKMEGRDLRERILKIYNDNFAWVSREYDGDIKAETMVQMAIEWTVDDCAKIIEEIIRESLSAKS